jgi:hypothetical protein
LSKKRSSISELCTQPWTGRKQIVRLAISAVSLNKKHFS